MNDLDTSKLTEAELKVILSLLEQTIVVQTVDKIRAALAPKSPEEIET
jgi:hypothetical protein